MKLSSKTRGKIAYLVYLSLLPCISFADADVAGTLNNFFAYLTGPLGQVIALLAIAGVGIGCFVLGKINKMWVIAVVVGIGCVFGAHSMLSMLEGSV
ncbi:MAG: TrbC/VirB2 family protein [Gammaproteobacteria bacterium]|nr:TrbC/VirB2 family protein [Gammaproteobacteria bacterium]